MCMPASELWSHGLTIGVGGLEYRFVFAEMWPSG